MVKILARIALLVLICSVNLLASGDGGLRSPFDVGFGAGQLGMGGASVAYVSNPNSVYWNPAGLTFLEQAEIELFYMSLFMDTRYNCLAFAYPTISTGVFGLGVCNLSSGNFTKISDYSDIGTFSTDQDLFLLGYGFSPLQNLATGITIKGVYYNLAGYKDTGFGFDLGAIYFVKYINGLSAGLKVSDVYSPRIKLHSLEQRFPLTVRGGLALRRKISGIHGLIFNADIEHVENAGVDFYAGTEFGYKNTIFARLGYMQDKLTLGMGISLLNIKIDYAYASLSELDPSHRFSLSYSFGTSVSARRIKDNEKRVQHRLSEYQRQQQLRIAETITEEIEKAEGFEENGEIYKSIESYYRVLGLDDQNEKALSKISSLFDRIRLDVARQASSEFIDNLTGQQLDIGDSYIAKKQYDKASEQYRLVLILDPENQQAFQNLAEIKRLENSRISRMSSEINRFVESGDYQLALNMINQLLQLKPDDSNALALKDNIYRQFEASSYLDKALKLFDQGEFNTANIMVDSALVLNPQSEGAQSLKRQLVRFTADVTSLEDIKKSDIHWEMYIRGMEKYQAGDYDEAVRIWRMLLEYYPNNPNLNRNIQQAAERSEKSK